MLLFVSFVNRISTVASFSLYENVGVIKSAGVEIRDVRSTLVPVRKELQQNFDLESYEFVPFVLDQVRSSFNSL